MRIENKWTTEKLNHKAYLEKLIWS